MKFSKITLFIVTINYSDILKQHICYKLQLTIYKLGFYYLLFTNTLAHSHVNQDNGGTNY